MSVTIKDRPILAFKESECYSFPSYKEASEFINERTKYKANINELYIACTEEKEMYGLNWKFKPYKEGELGMTVALAGVIGAGKSTLTKILSEQLGTVPLYEPVDDNPVLPLFYEGNKKVENGDWETNPYAFLLQIFFLNRRFRSIKEGLLTNNAIMDRSLPEDIIFAKMNYEQGNMTKIEWEMYKDLSENMMEEIKGLPKKSPDLMILIDVSYDTMLKRIKKRGREYEQVSYDPGLEEYYKDLIRRYDDWKHEYKMSPLLVIDGDKYDFVNSKKDLTHVLSLIYNKMYEVGCIDKDRLHDLQSQLEGIE